MKFTGAMAETLLMLFTIGIMVFMAYELTQGFNHIVSLGF